MIRWIAAVALAGCAQDPGTCALAGEFWAFPDGTDVQTWNAAKRTDVGARLVSDGACGRSRLENAAPLKGMGWGSGIHVFQVFPDGTAVQWLELPPGRWWFVDAYPDAGADYG